MFFGVNIKSDGNGRERLWLYSPIEREQIAPFRFDLLRGSSHLMKVIDGIALFNRWMTVLLAYVDKRVLRYFAIIDVASEWRICVAYINDLSQNFKIFNIFFFSKDISSKSSSVDINDIIEKLVRNSFSFKEERNSKFQKIVRIKFETVSKTVPSINRSSSRTIK